MVFGQCYGFRRHRIVNADLKSNHCYNTCVVQRYTMCSHVFRIVAAHSHDCSCEWANVPFFTVKNKFIAIYLHVTVCARVNVFMSSMLYFPILFYLEQKMVVICNPPTAHSFVSHVSNVLIWCHVRANKCEKNADSQQSARNNAFVYRTIRI